MAHVPPAGVQTDPGIDLTSIKRVLCILQPTHIYPRYERLVLKNSTQAWNRQGELKKLLAHPVHLANYRVNPRSASYMLKLATAFIQQNLPHAHTDLALDPALLSDLPNGVPEPFTNSLLDSHNGLHDLLSNHLKNNTYDLVLLLYPDPVGIGWNRLERLVYRTHKGPVAALNGRQRFFSLHPSTRRALNRRRFLERYWGAELLFTASFVLTLVPVMLWDLLTRLTRPLRGQGWTRPPTPSPEANDLQITSPVQNWWTQNPMVYGRQHGKPIYENDTGDESIAHLGDREFFEQVDRSFYEWNQPLHNEQGKFARIFPYSEYQNQRVLEIGCGMGTMSMNWALHQVQITPVDLTATAVRQTQQRLKLHNLPGTPCQAQAEHLPFPPETFPYVYSWGVLHHTPNTQRTFVELHRVLKPNGRTGVMLYSRRSILYMFWIRFYEGWVHRESRFLDPVALASRYGDGAREEGNPHTWPVTPSEVRNSLFAPFRRVRVRVLGTELDNIFKRAMPGLGHLLPRFIKKAYARIWGWSLWIEAEK